MRLWRGRGGSDGFGDEPGDREGQQEADEPCGDDGRAVGVAHHEGQDDGHAG